MSDEEWRPVVGWEGLYEVSSLGRVRSLHSGIRLLRPIRQRNKRLHVALCNKGARKSVSVHRLVAEAFIPNPDNLPFVLHWDDDPRNNFVENLRWGTHSENMYDSLRNGTHFHAQKTHCPQGHEYSEENTELTKKGRRCRTCSRGHTLKAYRGKALKPTDPQFVPHGTASGYEYHRCRCFKCKRAHADKNRGYK